MERLRRLGHLVTLGALVAVASLFTTLIGPTAQAHAVGTPTNEQKTHAQMIADIFDEHNKHRRQHGAPALVFSPAISLRVTQPFSNALAAKDNGTIWHNTAGNIGKGGSVWGENVAGGYKAETAAQLVQRWMDSPGHRANLLNRNYTTIAIGFTHGGSSGWTFSATNFYGRPSTPGPTYATGAAWLAAVNGGGSSAPSVPASSPDVNVYLTPGTHNVNGRQWRTVCSPYSQTKRCTTEIWGTKIERQGAGYTQTNGWVFNNLTYAPSARSLWAGNPLGGNGQVGGTVTWTSEGRQWRTECDTATTGRNGCRSYTTGTVIEQVGGTYRTTTKEIFNNMVLFG